MSGLFNNERVLKVPSSFIHTFNKDNIIYITYEFHPKKSSFREDKYHEAKVVLDKDGSSIIQKFYDDDMNNLIKQVQEFTEELK